MFSGSLRCFPPASAVACDSHYHNVGAQTLMRQVQCRSLRMAERLMATPPSLRQPSMSSRLCRMRQLSSKAFTRLPAPKVSSPSVTLHTSVCHLLRSSSFVCHNASLTDLSTIFWKTSLLGRRVLAAPMQDNVLSRMLLGDQMGYMFATLFRTKKMLSMITPVSSVRIEDL